jgi:hypothetical protein
MILCLLRIHDNNFMIDFTGSMEQGMGFILAMTDRIGIFGVSVTALIVGMIGLSWAVYLVRRTLATFFPHLDFSDDE